MIVQAGILVLGCLAIALISSKNANVRKWGFAVGFISEPFWMVAAVQAHQWGVLVLCVWWAVAYARGWWNLRRVSFEQEK